jgi:hypothetical protein
MEAGGSDLGAAAFETVAFETVVIESAASELMSIDSAIVSAWPNGFAVNDCFVGNQQH